MFNSSARILLTALAPLVVSIFATMPESQLERKQLVSGDGKSETISIASHVVSMSNNLDTAALFLKHWEEFIGEWIDGLMRKRFTAMEIDASSSTVKDSPKMYFAPFFFANSQSQRSLPFTVVALRQDIYQHHLSNIQKNLTC